MKRVALKDGKIVEKGTINSEARRKYRKKKDGTVIMTAAEWHALSNEKAHIEAMKAKGQAK